jgi:hypothetical protein
MLPILKVAASIVSAVAPIAYALYDKKDSKNQYIENQLYIGYMNGTYTKLQVKRLCKQYRIPFPPKFYENK